MIRIYFITIYLGLTMMFVKMIDTLDWTKDIQLIDKVGDIGATIVIMGITYGIVYLFQNIIEND